MPSEIDTAALDLWKRSSGEAPTAEATRSAGPDSPTPADEVVQSDPKLAQLEDDLERLRSQVASVSVDPSHLRRDMQEARARRDVNCHDKACLLRWYARRRSELLETF